MHDTEALTETQVGPPQGIQVEQKVCAAPVCATSHAHPCDQSANALTGNALHHCTVWYCIPFYLHRCTGVGKVRAKPTKLPVRLYLGTYAMPLY